MNCKGYSVLTHSICEKLGLSDNVSIVLAPGHAFVRFNDGKVKFNWDYRINREYSREIKEENYFLTKEQIEEVFEDKNYLMNVQLEEVCYHLVSSEYRYRNSALITVCEDPANIYDFISSHSQIELNIE